MVGSVAALAEAAALAGEAEGDLADSEAAVLEEAARAAAGNVW